MKKKKISLKVYFNNNFRALKLVLPTIGLLAISLWWFEHDSMFTSALGYIFIISGAALGDIFIAPLLRYMFQTELNDY